MKTVLCKLTIIAALALATISTTFADPVRQIERDEFVGEIEVRVERARPVPPKITKKEVVVRVVIEQPKPEIRYVKSAPEIRYVQAPPQIRYVQPPVEQPIYRTRTVPDWPAIGNTTLNVVNASATVVGGYYTQPLVHFRAPRCETRWYDHGNRFRDNCPPRRSHCK